MKLIKLTLLLFILANTFACSSTKMVNVEKLEKKPLISDHHLLMSLLNRPIPADQRMMLAFAKQQQQYSQQPNLMYVNAVMIIGDKTDQSLKQQPTNAYSSLIAKDINSIRVSGPF